MKVTLAVGFVVFLMVLFPFVYAQPQLAVTVNPGYQSVPQSTPANYMVSLTGNREAMIAPTYTLSVNGLPSGAQESFVSNPVTLTDGGAASTSLSLDLYCPGTYPFTVTASGSSGVGATSGPASLTVTQLGPSLQVSVSSDKPSYILGQTITITIGANRPAEGTLTVTSPSGASTSYPFAFALGETYSTTETLTAAQPYGTWTMSVQGDDYCGVMSTSSGQFTVGPNTYDVQVSVSGLPANLSAGLQVDGASQGKISGTQNKTLSFPIGTSHTITVDQSVLGFPNGTRYFAAQNSWAVAAAGSHVFSYQTQYLLTEEVGIGYGNKRGCTSPTPCNITMVDWSTFTTTAGYPLETSIWYPGGTIVTLGQPVPSVSGTNGTRFLQDGWDINCNNSGNDNCESGKNLPPTITMNEPVTAITLYDLQYRLWVISYYGNPQLQVPAGVPLSYTTEVPPTSGPPNDFTVNQASNPTVVSSWYNAGTMAFASVTSPVGFAIQYVFAYWTPNSSLVTSPTSPSTWVVMVKPMVLTAIWSASYTLLYAEVTGGVAAVAVIAVAAKYLGLGLRKPPAGGPGPVEEPVEEF